MKLYKKTIVIFARKEEEADNAALFAIKAVQLHQEVRSYGLGPAVEVDPENDPDADASVAEMFEDDGDDKHYSVSDFDADHGTDFAEDDDE